MYIYIYICVYIFMYICIYAAGRVKDLKEVVRWEVTLPGGHSDLKFTLTVSG